MKMNADALVKLLEDIRESINEGIDQVGKHDDFRSYLHLESTSDLIDKVLRSLSNISTADGNSAMDRAETSCATELLAGNEEVLSNMRKLHSNVLQFEHYDSLSSIEISQNDVKELKELLLSIEQNHDDE